MLAHRFHNLTCSNLGSPKENYHFEDVLILIGEITAAFGRVISPLTQIISIYMLMIEKKTKVLIPQQPILYEPITPYKTTLQYSSTC